MNTGEPYAEYKYLVNGAFYQLIIKSVKTNSKVKDITLKGVYCDNDKKHNFYFIANDDFVSHFYSNSGVSVLECETAVNPCTVYKMYVDMEWKSITVSSNVVSAWQLSIKPSKFYDSNSTHSEYPFLNTRLDIQLKPLQLSLEATPDSYTYNALMSVAENCVIKEEDTEVEKIAESIDTQKQFAFNTMQEHNTNVHSLNGKLSPESPYIESNVPKEVKTRKNKGKKKKTVKADTIFAREILATIRHVLQNKVNKTNVDVSEVAEGVIELYKNNLKLNDKMMKVIKREINAFKLTFAQEKHSGGKMQGSKQYVMYCKVRYLLRKGERGGEYIIVKGKKVYISQKKRSNSS